MFKTTTNQSSVTLLHTIDPRNRCAETPESLHVPVPFFRLRVWGIEKRDLGERMHCFRNKERSINITNVTKNECITNHEFFGLSGLSL